MLSVMEVIYRENIEYNTNSSENKAINMEVNEEIDEVDGEEEITRIVKKVKNIDNQATLTAT